MSTDPPDADSSLRTVYTTLCSPFGADRASGYLACLGARDASVSAVLHAAVSDPHGGWVPLEHDSEGPFTDPDGNKVAVRVDHGTGAYEIAVAGPRAARFEHPRTLSARVSPYAASPHFSTVRSGLQIVQSLTGDRLWADSALVRDVRTGETAGSYYFNVRIGCYVAERASGGRATVPDERQAETYIAARGQSADRWAAFCDRYSEDLHRGIHVHLPPPLHDYVHDEDEPRGERAAGLQEYFAPAGLGTHWTAELRVSLRAIINAADGDSSSHGAWARAHGTDEDPHHCQDEDAGGTDIVFHAARPGERNRLRNPDELSCYRIGHGFGADEREFPLKPGSPLRLTGISWRLHNPGYPAAPFEHADFPAPVRHVSSPGPAPRAAARDARRPRPGPRPAP